MDNILRDTSPPLPFNKVNNVTFRCNVDKHQYLWLLILLCLFLVIILIASPNILWGIFGMFFVAPPLVAALLFSYFIWRQVTYTVDNNMLLISSPLKSIVIDIATIKKIRRGKFWVERGRNYSASYIKLRIIYGNNKYIYVSPENEEYFVNLLCSVNPNITYSSERNI